MSSYILFAAGLLCQLPADLQQLFYDVVRRRAVQQNFVPVVDDWGTFIGIVTRQDIIRYFIDS